MIDVIGFDGDDTLWHNESIFSVTQDRFRTLLREYRPEPEIDDRLLATETRNLTLFGYGIKGFTLSMIETAIEVSGGLVAAADIQTIIDFGKAMLDHPVQLLDGAGQVVDDLAGRHRLVLVTKGDLFDQESKIARSGLAERFSHVEVVSEKDEATYRRLLDAHHIAPARFLMVGNSLRSDVLPVLGVGSRAVHVPYHLTWAHEHADAPPGRDERYWVLDDLRGLPALVARLDGET